MSYPYSAYAVPLAKLRAIVGSKDAKLAGKLTARDADNASWFADKIAAGAPTLAQAVAQIIAGTVPKRSKHGFQYGYAVELLVQHVGTRIDEDELGFGCERAIDPYLKTAKQPSTAKLTKHGVFPIAIPAPADFPGIGTLTANDMAALVAAFDQAAPRWASDDDALTVSAAFRSWCAKARKRKRELVWFYY